MTNEKEPAEETAPEAETQDAAPATQEAGVDEPQVLERRETSASNSLKRAIFDVPIEVVVSVGKVRPLIGDLLTMGRNHLLPLDAKLEDPVELLVKDRVIARGELTQAPDAEGMLAVRLTEVVNINNLTE